MNADELLEAAQFTQTSTVQLLKDCRKKLDRMRTLYDALPKKQRTRPVKKQLAQTTLEHSKLLKASLEANRMLDQLQAPPGKVYTKFPTLPTKLQLTLDLSLNKRTAEAFLDALEVFFLAHQFPRREHEQERWSQMLSQAVSTKAPEELSALRQMGNLAWDDARTEFLARFVKATDGYEYCQKLLLIKQGAKEHTLAYSERFLKTARDTFAAGAEPPGWQESLLLYRFLLVDGLRPSLKELVLDDSKFKDATDIPKIVDLAREVEETASRKAAFEAASAGAPPGGTHAGRARKDEHAPRAEPDASHAKRGGRKERERQRADRERQRAERPPATGNSADQFVKKPAAAPTGGSDAPHEKATCSRCDRPHSGACQAEFHADGRRLPGVPPGKPQGWTSTYRGCKICGKLDHLEKACKDKRANLDGPAVKAIRARIQQLNQQSSPRNDELERSPKKRARVTMEHDGRPDQDSEYDSDDQGSPADEAHDNCYGCSICGDGDHITADCPANTYTSSQY